MDRTMVDVVCDTLRKSGFVIIYKKQHWRWIEIWLEHEVKVYLYRDRVEPFVNGKRINAWYIRSVVACLKKRLCMESTFYSG